MSDTARERRGADPELRRKLNDMTHKYENLSLKYQSLQEIGQDNAESNFERLKRASDQKARDAQELITSLKKEIAELKKQPSATAANKDFAPEIADLKKQTSALTNANSSLETERDGLKSCLQISQNEVKSLEVKLVAARHQLSNGAPTSGNNAKTPKDLHRSVGPNATETQKEAKMKENLYSDLTGLIIRGVKRKEGEDEYDCIQTGRNGSESSVLSSFVQHPLTQCLSFKPSTSTFPSSTTPPLQIPKRLRDCPTRKPNSHMSPCSTKAETVS